MHHSQLRRFVPVPRYVDGDPVLRELLAKFIGMFPVVPPVDEDLLPDRPTDMSQLPHFQPEPDCCSALFSDTDSECDFSGFTAANTSADFSGFPMVPAMSSQSAESREFLDSSGSSSVDVDQSEANFSGFSGSQPHVPVIHQNDVGKGIILVSSDELAEQQSLAGYNACSSPVLSASHVELGRRLRGVSPVHPYQSLCSFDEFKDLVDEMYNRIVAQEAVVEEHNSAVEELVSASQELGDLLQSISDVGFAPVSEDEENGEVPVQGQVDNMFELPPPVSIAPVAAAISQAISCTSTPVLSSPGSLECGDCSLQWDDALVRADSVGESPAVSMTTPSPMVTSAATVINQLTTGGAWGDRYSEGFDRDSSIAALNVKRIKVLHAQIKLAATPLKPYLEQAKASIEEFRRRNCSNIQTSVHPGLTESLCNAMTPTSSKPGVHTRSRGKPLLEPVPGSLINFRLRFPE